MDPNQGLNISNSKINYIHSDKSEKKGLLKGSEIIDKATQDLGKIDKIKKIKSLIGENAQSTNVQNKSLENRLELSLSPVKENEKIKEKTNNSIHTERTNASLSKTNRMQNKTAIIKEKCIRYLIDPDKQVEDILEYVDSFYKDHPLKSMYNFAKQLVEIDDLRNISGDMQKEIEEATKKREVNILITRLCKINMYRKEIKKYGENDRYAFNPLVIAKIAAASNELLECVTTSKSSYALESPIERQVFLNEIKNQPLSHILGKILDKPPEFPSEVSPELLSTVYFYKHFYPIILCGDLTIYTFEAEIYAYANNLTFLGIGGSERGVHGGLLKSPRDVFFHDVGHHRIMLGNDSPNQAIYIQQLSQTLLDIIEHKISDDLKEPFYFASHLLIHERITQNKNDDILVSKNPNLSTIFDFFYCDLLLNLFNTFGLRSHEYEPTECYIRNLQLEEERLRQKFQHIPEAENNKLMQAYQKCENYKKNHPFLDDLSQLREKRYSVSYDIIEALLFVTTNEEKKEELQSKILPNFPNTSKFTREICRAMHHINSETDKNSEKFKAYAKDYNNQLYVYKTNNFDHVEAYKAVKDLLFKFKEIIVSYLEEFDKKNGPIDVSNYKNVWERGQEIKQ